MKFIAEGLIDPFTKVETLKLPTNAMGLIGVIALGKACSWNERRM